MFSQIFGGEGEGGGGEEGGGDMWRGPQSVQSEPWAQLTPRAPSPPSWQTEFFAYGPPGAKQPSARHSSEQSIDGATAVMDTGATAPRGEPRTLSCTQKAARYLRRGAPMNLVSVACFLGAQMISVPGSCLAFRCERFMSGPSES